MFLGEFANLTAFKLNFDRVGDRDIATNRNKAGNLGGFHAALVARLALSIGEPFKE